MRLQVHNCDNYEIFAGQLTLASDNINLTCIFKPTLILNDNFSHSFKISRTYIGQIAQMKYITGR